MAKKKIVGTVTVNDTDRTYEMVVTDVQVFPCKDTAASLGHIKATTSEALCSLLHESCVNILKTAFWKNTRRSMSNTEPRGTGLHRSPIHSIQTTNQKELSNV